MASDGPEYFRLNVLDALVPSRTYGLRLLKGTVVSSELVGAAPTLVIAISDKNTPEVTLRLSRLSPSDLHIREGTVIEFEGAGVSFRPSPFMLTLDVSVCQWAANDAAIRCELERRAPR